MDEEITNYVLLENLAVLKNEMRGIEQFKQILREVNPDDYNEIDEFIKEIENRFRVYIEKGGLVEAVYSLVERKIRKVLKYVTHE